MSSGEADGNLGQSQELHEYGMSRGHPPIAEKLALIDFDGTIVPWGPLMGDKTPTPGAKEAIDLLVQSGYRIGIFTSRMSRTWAESVKGRSWTAQNIFLEDQWEYVKRTLDAHGIPFEFITAEKVPAEFYIDDKAIGYRGDWTEVLRDSLVKAVEVA